VRARSSSARGAAFGTSWRFTTQQDQHRDFLYLNYSRPSTLAAAGRADVADRPKEVIRAVKHGMI
jgi:hypothetical protein